MNYRIFAYIFLLICCLFSCKNETSTLKSTEPKPNYIINEDGDSIPTGVPIPVKLTRVPDSALKIEYRKVTGTPKVVSERTNTRLIDPPEVRQVEVKVSTIVPGENGFPTPETIHIEGKVVPAIQPPPVPALPPSMKDDATKDFQYWNMEHGLGYSVVYAIKEDSKGNLWIGTRGGVSKYDGRNFWHYTPQEGFIANVVHSILEDSKGNIWFETSEGLCRYDGHYFTHYYLKTSGWSVSSLLEDRSGNLWMKRENMLTQFMPDKVGDGGYVAYYDKITSSYWGANNIIIDEEGYLWTVMDQSILLRFDPANSTQIKTYYINGVTNISAIAKDPIGNLWLGTNNGELNQLPLDLLKNVNNVDYINLNHFALEELAEPIRGLSVDSRGELWAWAINKFIRLNGSRLSLFEITEDLGKNQIRSFLKDHRGNIWVGTNGDGMFNYRPESFVHFTSKVGLSSDNVMKIE